MVTFEKLSEKAFFTFKDEKIDIKELKYPLKITWVGNGQARMFLNPSPVPHIELDSHWQG